MTDLPILYSFRRCPYAMRARMAIFSSQIICEYREVKLAFKPLEMLKLSKKGTVPVLLLRDGSVIDESIDIMYWSLKQNDPLELLNIFNEFKFIITDTIDLVDGKFKFHLDRYKYYQRYKDKNPEFHRDCCLDILNTIDEIIKINNNLFDKNKLSF